MGVPLGGEVAVGKPRKTTGGWENMTEDVPKNGDVHRYSTTNTIKHIA
jgi:hypothetical protein